MQYVVTYVSPKGECKRCCFSNGRDAIKFAREVKLLNKYNLVTVSVYAEA